MSEAGDSKTRLTESALADALYEYARDDLAFKVGLPTTQDSAEAMAETLFRISLSTSNRVEARPLTIWLLIHEEDGFTTIRGVYATREAAEASLPAAYSGGDYEDHGPYCCTVEEWTVETGKSKPVEFAR